MAWLCCLYSAQSEPWELGVVRMYVYVGYVVVLCLCGRDYMPRD
jgi:hypothetical protein